MPLKFLSFFKTFFLNVSITLGYSFGESSGRLIYLRETAPLILLNIPLYTIVSATYL